MKPLFQGAGGDPEQERPLRVAFFVHAFFPDHVYGTESYTLALARQMMALGHDPVVVTASGPNCPPQGEEVERYEFEGIKVLRIDRNRHPSHNAREDYHLPALAPLLRRLIEEIRPDVVHVCHLANFTAVLTEVTQALAIPTFATLTDFFNLCLNGMLEIPGGKLCHGPDAHRVNCMACGLLQRRFERPNPFWVALGSPAIRPLVALAGARLAPLLPPPLGTDARAVVERPQMMAQAMGRYAAAIAPTRFLRDIFAANGAPMPLVHSTFGIDIDRSAKPPAPAGPVRLGFVGQLLTHKGPHILVKALRYLPPQSYTLDIWGSEQLHPAYAQDLRQVAEGMPVRFRGTFEEERTAAIFAEMDVLVMPSTWFENGPLTLLKALATHTPVVVSDVPGMTEFVTENVDGFSFPREDEAVLAATLRRFVEDPDLARSMSAATHYPRTERAMAEDVLALYRRFGAASPAADGAR